MPRTALTLAVAATVASLAMAGSMPQPLPTQSAADSSAAVDARRHRGRRGRYGHHGHHHGHHGHDDDDDDGHHGGHHGGHGGDDDCGSLSMASFDSDNGHYMPSSAHGRHGRHGEHDGDDDRKIPRHVVVMAAGVALLAFVSALVAVLVCYCKKACCFAAVKGDDDNAPDAPHTLEVVSSAPDYVDEHAVMKKADPLAGSGALPLPLQVTADGVVIDESSALPGVVATVEVSTPKAL